MPLRDSVSAVRVLPTVQIITDCQHCAGGLELHDSSESSLFKPLMGQHNSSNPYRISAVFVFAATGPQLSDARARRKRRRGSAVAEGALGRLKQIRVAEVVLENAGQDCAVCTEHLSLLRQL
jgi:hypothetical protein